MDNLCSDATLISFVFLKRQKEKLFEMQTFIALPANNIWIDSESGIKIPDMKA